MFSVNSIFNPPLKIITTVSNLLRERLMATEQSENKKTDFSSVRYFLPFSYYCLLRFGKLIE